MRPDRRKVLRYSVWPLAALVATSLPACQEVAADTPKTIKYGRDACDQCAMLISDARFAAQVWHPEKRRFGLFDDLGCAVVHAVEHRLIDRADARIWAADFDDQTAWLDARAAHFRCGLRTPMDYGFAATRAPGPDRVDFETMRTRVVEKAHCAPRPASPGA